LLDTSSLYPGDLDKAVSVARGYYWG